MSDWPGSLSSGEVRIPATFHGTARLLDGTETPTPPRPARHDDLPGRFEADLDISFALLIGVGYQPVDPSHPAWPLYLAARDEHERIPPAEPVPGIDPNSPDAVVMPFETTVTITEAMALRFGLVAPGRAGSAGAAGGPSRPVQHKPPPPLWHRSAGIGANRTDAPLPPIGDFSAFLDFLSDPVRHPTHAKDDVHSAAARSNDDAEPVGIPSPAGMGARSSGGWHRTGLGAPLKTTQDDPARSSFENGSAEAASTRAVPDAAIRGARGTGRFGRDRMANVDLNALGLGDALRAITAPLPSAPVERVPVVEPGSLAVPEAFAALSGATPPSGSGHRVLDMVMTPRTPLPPAIRTITSMAGSDRTGRQSATNAGSSGADTQSDVAAMQLGMREADRSPLPSESVQMAQAGASDVPTVSHVEDKPTVASPHGDTKPVLLVDGHGNPVMSQGRTVERPASLDPEMFVRQGLADKAEYDALGTTDEGAAAQLVYLGTKLSKFGQGHEWDAQRVGGTFNPAYVDYATIAIGLYSPRWDLARTRYWISKTDMQHCAVNIFQERRWT